ncbi:lipoate protein ligase C-terminal domain-containing protein [Bacillus sp. 37MA]|uniref:lipoate protein ligase C-terminal domain-containing protein n=1 Tax=Bacillus sp. 37MA TaxID=1132442 RepID=UPI0003615FBA
MLTNIFEGEENIKEYKLTDNDWQTIHSISKDRYQNWDWNYGKSPVFNIQRSHRFPIGLIDVRLNVKKGLIEHVHIYGDFFGAGDVHEVETALKEAKHEKEAIEKALQSLEMKHYFGQVTLDEMVKLIY